MDKRDAFKSRNEKLNELNIKVKQLSKQLDQYFDDTNERYLKLKTQEKHFTKENI